MNKEIEEIVNILDKGSQSGMIVEVSSAIDRDNNIVEDDYSTIYTRNEILANRIYDAGYRKVSDVATDIIELVKAIKKECLTSTKFLSNTAVANEIIYGIEKKYVLGLE